MKSNGCTTKTLTCVLPKEVAFRGFFAFGATYHPSKQLFFDIDIQPAYNDKLTGFVKAGISFKISKNSNQFVYLQYFGGYSEDLIDFDQAVSNLRLGIAFKDLFQFRNNRYRKSR